MKLDETKTIAATTPAAAAATGRQRINGTYRRRGREFVIRRLNRRYLERDTLGSAAPPASTGRTDPVM